MTAASKYRLVVTGGGTGGHLFPAIAIADRVREMVGGDEAIDIRFVGTKRGIEYRRRDQLGAPLHTIFMRPIVRSLTPRNLLLPIVLMTALTQAVLLLGRLRPDVVVGTGGYASWPVLRVAVARHIPVMLQEQNSYPGMVTRQIAPRAERVFLGFERARSYLKTQAPLDITGNPVRPGLNRGDRTEALRSFGLDPDKKTILILGGSQGARAINQAITRGLQNQPLPNEVQLLWQTGKRDYRDVTANVGNKATGCTLFPFAERMDLVYAAADLAVARAGALTIAELIECGLPSILVPYPHAAADHQRHNAEAMAEKGLARVIDEKDLATRDLLAEAVNLLGSAEFESIRGAIRAHTAERRPAVDVIAERVIERMKSRREEGAPA